MPSYYELLGVEPDADQEAIRTAFSDAIRRAAHPDGGPGRHDRQLDEAYAVIGDPARRARYDELRSTAGARGNPELLALLSVIADTGSIPTAEAVLAPPPDPEPASEGPRLPEAGVMPDAAVARRDAAALAGPVLTPVGVAPTAPVPGTDGDRRDLGWRRSLLGVVLLAVVVGVALGLLLRGGGAQATFAVGDCASLEAGTGTALPCDDPAADARITEVAPDPGACAAATLGTLDLGTDGVGCLGPITAPGG